MYVSNVSKTYWPKFVETANYLKNRTVTRSTFENKTAYEIFFKERPNIGNLKLYGSKVFVRTPDSKRADKSDSKSEVRILLGYDKVGDKVLLIGKLIVARNVKVIEGKKDLIGFTGFDFDFDRDEESSNAS